MEPITQIQLNEVEDNDLDQRGNKIKLRSVSHDNLTKNISNIPYLSNPVNSVEEEKQEESLFTLLPKTDMEVTNGPSKAINIKKPMLANMLKHVLNKDESKKTVVADAEKKEIIKPLETPVDIEEEKVEETTPTATTMEEETPSLYNQDLDLEKYFSEVNKERQIVSEIKQEADTAKLQSVESEKELGKLFTEENEMQKKLEDAKLRKEEINRKIIEAYENQKKTLATVKEKYQSVINEANRNKENNQARILESRMRIDDVKNKLTDVEEEIAKKQNILNAINDLEVSDNIFSLITPKQDEIVTEEPIKARNI